MTAVIRVDLLKHAEIAEFTEVSRRASSATDPAQMLSTLGPWLRRMRRSDFFISVSQRDLPAGQYKITRVIDNPNEQIDQSRMNPWRDWNRITAHSGGLIGEILSGDGPQLFKELDVTDDPVLGIAVREMRSLLAVPNFDDGEPLNWGVFFRRNPEGWALDEITRIMQDTNLLGLATKNLVEKKRASELNERYIQQLEQVAQVQRSLLPATTPSHPSIEIATSYLTSDEAGGDFYDFICLPEGKIGVLIADVAGHGPAAATVMAMLRAILLCYEHDDHDPAFVMRYCNRKLAAANLGASFTTAFFAVLDPETGELVYSRWGHNPPRLRRASGGVESLDRAGSLPLGIDHEAQGDVHALTLHPGDTVLLYTDGITEAAAPLNAHGVRDMFSVERLDAALTQCTGKPECVIDSVHAALLEHVGAMTRDDDQTLVALRFLGAGARA
ncbi:MAG: PP2C family protein-serine/threonine phosphatase [Phycisphaerales bacterium JB040]